MRELEIRKLEHELFTCVRLIQKKIKGGYFMKRYLVLLLVLVFVFSVGVVSMAEPFFKIDLAVTVSNANTNVTYTAKLTPPPDAPKLIYFYTAPVNQPFPQTPVGIVWTDIYQVARFSFHQDSGSYQAIAVWADGDVKSNIVKYIVP
jgi:hypothetical protein